MLHFLASVWKCIHSDRRGAYYTLSEAVTAFSEGAKHFKAQTTHPGAHTPRHTHTHSSDCTQIHWHNVHRPDERANLSKQELRQARGRTVPVLVWRRRAGCSCVCVCVRTVIQRQSPNNSHSALWPVCPLIVCLLAVGWRRRWSWCLRTVSFKIQRQSSKQTARQAVNFLAIMESLAWTHFQ